MTEKGLTRLAAAKHSGSAYLCANFTVNISAVVFFDKIFDKIKKPNIEYQISVMPQNKIPSCLSTSFYFDVIFL